MFLCRFKRKDISASLDGELSESKRRRLVKHMQSCSECSDFLESLRQSNLRVDQYLYIRRQFIPADAANVPAEPASAELSGGVPDIETAARKDGILTFILRQAEALFSQKNPAGADAVSPDGTVSVSFAAKVIPAILLALAIILLYTQKLEAVYI